MTTFSRLLIDRLHRQPEATALVLQRARQPDLPISVRELMDSAAGWQQRLNERGVQPGEVVLLILQHGPDLVYAYFGCVLNGSIPAIMPFLTEKLLPERYRAELSALLGVTRPVAVVTYPDFEGEVRAAMGAESPVRQVIVSGPSPKAPRPPSRTGNHCPACNASPDIALLQHSSGTTGLQKGVALSHRAGAAAARGLFECAAARTRAGCDRLMAAALSRHGADRQLPDAAATGSQTGADVALRLGAGALPPAAEHLSPSRDTHLAAQLCL
jgi:acyl-CoA synthetase (AMP-forming)/AMP-acid ligase II